DHLSAQPQATVPQACGTWKDTKAAYRFWANPRVRPAAIPEGHVAAPSQRLLEHDVVLAVQDTSEANFSHHPTTQGLGYLDHPACRGLKFHSVLAVSTAGVPLGLALPFLGAKPAKNRCSRVHYSQAQMLGKRAFSAGKRRFFV